MVRLQLSEQTKNAAMLRVQRIQDLFAFLEWHRLSACASCPADNLCTDATSPLRRFASKMPIAHHRVMDRINIDGIDRETAPPKIGHQEMSGILRIPSVKMFGNVRARDQF